METDIKIFLGPGAGDGAEARILREDESTGAVYIKTGTNALPGLLLASFAYGEPFGDAPVSLLLSGGNVKGAAALPNLYAPVESLTDRGFEIYVGEIPLQDETEYVFYYMAGF